MCIRVSSFFPARVTGLRARENGTIPDHPDQNSARRRIEVNPSWIVLNESFVFEAKLALMMKVVRFEEKNGTDDERNEI